MPKAIHSPHHTRLTEILVAQRRKVGLTQAQVAKALGRHPPFIANIESGERNGTANLFMLFAPLEGWRHVKVTDHHTAVDYAGVLKELADIFARSNYRSPNFR